jgi:hypothetical protein
MNESENANQIEIVRVGRGNRGDVNHVAKMRSIHGRAHDTRIMLKSTTITNGLMPQYINGIHLLTVPRCDRRKSTSLCSFAVRPRRDRTPAG